MPARYPPIDRLPPIQIRVTEHEGAGTGRGRADPAARGRAERGGPGRRHADQRNPTLTPPLAGRLAGLDAVRGLALLLFAWAVLLPLPLPALLGDAAVPPAPPWAGPGAALLASLKPAVLLEPAGAGAGTLVPAVLLAAAMFALGAGVPLAAARRGGNPGGRWTRLVGSRTGLLASLPLRFTTLVLVAVLVPVMRPETLGTGPSAALSLLAFLGLVPLTLRFGSGVTRAGRWTLRAGGLGLCLLVLCLRLGVDATEAAAWTPDPVVLAMAINGLLAALLWLVTPGANAISWSIRLLLGLAAAAWMFWLPPVLALLDADGWSVMSALRGRTLAGFPLLAWVHPAWLVGLPLVVAGTIVGDLGVRHLRELVPPPAGALPREDPEETRWGAGGVVLMALLLLAAPAAGVALCQPTLGLLGGLPRAEWLPLGAVAAALTLLPVLLARLLMAGRADASGRWARSLGTLTASLLLLAVLAGAATAALGGGALPGGEMGSIDQWRAAGTVFATLLGLAGGLVALLTALTVVLDRPTPVVPLTLALPLTGVGRNPLLLYALLAGPVLVIFGHPWLPVAPVGTGFASIDGWTAFVITELWGPDPSPVHGVGYALLKALALALPTALLSRVGVVLRA